MYRKTRSAIRGRWAALMVLLLLLAVLTLPAAAQATVFQTNTTVPPVTVEQPADDAGPAAETTEAPADTVGDVVDDLVDAGEGAVLGWLGTQSVNTQTILIVVVVAGVGVFLAVVGSNVVVTRQLAQLVNKATEQALESARLTPSPWDDRILELVKAISGVVLQAQSQAAGPIVLTGATGADVSRDEVEAEG